MSDIQRLADADEFYLPAACDFLFLEEYCHETKTTLRINARIDVPFIREGVHVGTIADTIPFPDFLHFIQTSYAFAEKALKCLVCLQDPSPMLEQVRRYGHNLAALISRYRTIVEAEAKIDASRPQRDQGRTGRGCVRSSTCAARCPRE